MNHMTRTLLTASQRVDIVSKIAMILQLISGIVQIVLMVTTKNYYMYAVILPLTTLFNNILKYYLIMRKAYIESCYIVVY